MCHGKWYSFGCKRHSGRKSRYFKKVNGGEEGSET